MNPPTLPSRISASGAPSAASSASGPTRGEGKIESKQEREIGHGLVVLLGLGNRYTHMFPMPKEKESISEQEWRRVRIGAIAKQIAERGVRDPKVLNAMQEIPRHLFLPPAISRALAYADRPLPIGHNQTISQPYIAAYIAEKLELTGKEIVLEIGTGSGYQAAVLSLLAKEVFSVEYVPELAQFAEQNLRRIRIPNVEIKVDDGYYGWMENAPFDRIVLTACCPEIPPTLLKQLNSPGILIAPIGDKMRQKLVLIEKIPNPPNPPKIVKKELISVMFVPMRGETDKTPEK